MDTTTSAHTKMAGMREQHDYGRSDEDYASSSSAADYDQEDDEGWRDGDDRFLYSIGVDGMKMLLTLDSRDRLFVITDALVSAIIRLIPAFSEPPAELLVVPKPMPLPADQHGYSGAQDKEPGSPQPPSSTMSMADWIGGSGSASSSRKRSLSPLSSTSYVTTSRSTSKSARAKCSGCSDPTARARRPCCAS